MALSDQLTDLASRTRRLEDSAADVKAQNRAKLEQERERLHSAMQSTAQNVRSSASEARANGRSWWEDVTTRIDQRRAELRAKLEQRRAERQVERAQRNAAEAEEYAADMVSLAVYAIDEAEYAVVDAAIAQAEADALLARA